MKRKEMALQNFPIGKPALNEVLRLFNVTDVLKSQTRSYIDELNLFQMHFNELPNKIVEVNIDCQQANSWFYGEHVGDIYKTYYCKVPLDNSSESVLDDIFYFLDKDLIVNFDTNNNLVRFLFRKTDILMIEEIIQKIRKFKISRGNKSPEISFLVNTNRGLTTKTLNFTKPEFSIDENYNDDFKPVHETIIKRLSRTHDKGIVLLHGKPGTGKTTYIRHLILSVEKEVIFLPPNMAAELTNPDLIDFLMDKPNSVFVIEDAESIIQDREHKGNSPVSTLLNLSDGLISDCLNIQVVCSFNTDLSKIDKALMRKGRLIAKYEFKELEVRKAQALSDRLGFDRQITYQLNRPVFTGILLVPAGATDPFGNPINEDWLRENVDDTYFTVSYVGNTSSDFYGYEITALLIEGSDIILHSVTYYDDYDFLNLMDGIKYLILIFS